MGSRYRTAQLDEELRRLGVDDADDAHRRNNVGALGMDSNHTPIEDDDQDDAGLLAAYKCRVCDQETQVAPPQGHKFARLRGDEADAGSPLEFTCSCGAENRVHAPTGYKLVTAEAAGRRRARHVADETMASDCEGCGRENRFRPPKGHRLLADEGEGVRRARVGEVDRGGVTTEWIDRLLESRYQDPMTLAIKHAADRSGPLVDRIWRAHDPASLREGWRRPDATVDSILAKYFGSAQ